MAHLVHDRGRSRLSTPLDSDLLEAVRSWVSATELLRDCQFLVSTNLANYYAQVCSARRSVDGSVSDHWRGDGGAKEGRTKSLGTLVLPQAPL